MPVWCTTRFSVLGPLIFAMYISPISNIVTAHRLRYQQYADYAQLYMAMRPGDGSTFDALSRCVDDVYRWFLENGMMLNPSKTAAVLFGTRVQRVTVDTAAGVEVAGVSVSFGNSVKLLGVNLDALLTMDRLVTDVIRSCNFHLRALRHIRSSLDLDTAKMIALNINHLKYSTNINKYYKRFYQQ